MKFFIAIPTYNGGDIWRETVINIKKNAPKNTFVQVIDSGSKDETVAVATKAGFDVISITSEDFNHGDTRNKVVFNNINQFDIVIFLTQDAIPTPGFTENIVQVFSDPSVACAYGRQLPHKDATPLAEHARRFNYPEASHICDLSNAATMGLKAVFMSNSFAAYRLSTFNKLGGFPSNTILCEDMYFAAKALLSGYKSAYVANAVVKHSHNYTAIEEFKRYFDIGVFHTDQPWIKKEFGGAGHEGSKFIVSEIKFISITRLPWLVKAFFNNSMKILGYKLGSKYKLFPIEFIKKFSMHKKYWT
ncbi:glycosyltransferase family 2 protein [Pluralibacter gergoviae]|uniref:glycosyltransferase n=1 Tax=Pluralibacter gergoviae TaxID=61647 RepID=UPI000908086F|nr:glycosyltransferase [Pluralibacter gergoviae]SUB70552.1 Predicted glycosyl hydrolase [Pluralibacter gergoviae]